MTSVQAQLANMPQHIKDDWKNYTQSDEYKAIQKYARIHFTHEEVVFAAYIKGRTDATAWARTLLE